MISLADAAKIIVELRNQLSLKLQTKYDIMVNSIISNNCNFN